MGIIIINEHNVVSKLEIHRILSTNAALIPYLPATDIVTYQSVKQMLEEYQNLFLKPVTASVGKGIVRVRKGSASTIAEFNVLGQTKRQKTTVQQIVRMIHKQKSEYLVQQGISLMTYKGKLVDFRVSVQKDGNGKWQCTGIVARIATKGAVVTNMHCGGKPIKASEVFHYWNWDSSAIEALMTELGVRIGETLDQHLPLVADIGLDIALDDRQHPWLIEVNFRDLRITFRDAGEREKWRATFENPVNFAAFLMNKLKDEQLRTSSSHIIISSFSRSSL